MKGLLGFLKVLLITLIASCALNSLLMELNIVPKQAAGYTGVDVNAPGPTDLDTKRKDVMYGDFWMVDKKPKCVNGYASKIDNDQGNYQIEFPTSF